MCKNHSLHPYTPKAPEFIHVWIGHKNKYNTTNTKNQWRHSECNILTVIICFNITFTFNWGFLVELTIVWIFPKQPSIVHHVRTDRKQMRFSDCVILFNGACLHSSHDPESSVGHLQFTKTEIFGIAVSHQDLGDWQKGRALLAMSNWQPSRPQGRERPLFF